jgi:hypothetical protein
MHKARVAVIGVALVLSACAGGRNGLRPDWVDGASTQYSDAQYLIGRGQADNQEDAKNRARADLAKVFEVAVRAESEDTQSYKSESANGQGDARSATQVTRTIATRTDQVIQGVRIADLWQDPTTKSQYVLAVLSRAQAAASLRQEIERLDAATRTYIGQARGSSDLFAQIAAASHALQLQVERQGYQKTLKVIDRSGRGVEPEWSAAKLSADLDGLLKRVHVAPRVAGKSVEGLDTAVAGGLSAAGFAVDTGQNADYTLEATLDLDDLGHREGWYWTKGTLQITLYDRASGRVRGTRRWDIKAAGQEAVLARRRAMDQVESILKTQLRDSLIAFTTA